MTTKQLELGSALHSDMQTADKIVKHLDYVLDGYQPPVHKVEIESLEFEVSRELLVTIQLALANKITILATEFDTL